MPTLEALHEEYRVAVGEVRYANDADVLDRGEHGGGKGENASHGYSDVPLRGSVPPVGFRVAEDCGGVG